MLVLNQNTLKELFFTILFLNDIGLYHMIKVFDLISCFCERCYSLTNYLTDWSCFFYFFILFPKNYSLHWQRITNHIELNTDKAIILSESGGEDNEFKCCS